MCASVASSRRHGNEREAKGSMQGWSSWTGALVLGPLLGGLLVWLMVRPRQRSLVRRLEDCDGQRQQAVLRAEALSARCEAAEAGRSEASARQAQIGRASCREGATVR